MQRTTPLNLYSVLANIPVNHDDIIPIALLPKTGRAHLIGIGGCGMQSLAAVLRARRWQVTGSDLQSSEDSPGVAAGHAAENVPGGIDLVVYSDAVGPENCERRRAAQLGLLQLSYPQALGQLMREGVGLAVAGTHGKSTTTAMAAQVLQVAGLHPTVICGARTLQGFRAPSVGSPSQDKPLVLVEACEYRANFLHLKPQITVLLGIEPDHFDYYQSNAQLHSAFARFAQQTRAGGTLLVSAHCPIAMAIAEKSGHGYQTFGIGTEADWQAIDLQCERGRYRFRLFYQGRSLGVVKLRVLGRHNVLNALAAAALAHEAGASDESLVLGLWGFRGIERRLEHVGSLGQATWIDDYAHHPTEVTAALRAAREIAPQGRVFCVFQPHQLSRTRSLLDEFALSLQNADNVLIAEIYQAREGQPGESQIASADISAIDLAARARVLGVAVDPRHRPHDIADRLKEFIREGTLQLGDVLITMGAGDIGAKLRAELLSEGFDDESVPMYQCELTSSIASTLQA